MAEMKRQAVTHEGYIQAPIPLDPMLLVTTTTGRDDPPQGSTKMTKKREMREAIRYHEAMMQEVTQERDAARVHAKQLDTAVQGLRNQVETMKRHWRPVPLAHEWEPRDQRCALCDDPRDSPRHTKTPPTVDGQPLSCGCG